jgi:hypothetical protein
VYGRPPLAHPYLTTAIVGADRGPAVPGAHVGPPWIVPGIAGQLAIPLVRAGPARLTDPELGTVIVATAVPYPSRVPIPATVALPVPIANTVPVPCAIPYRVPIPGTVPIPRAIAGRVPAAHTVPVPEGIAGAVPDPVPIPA